MMDYDEDLSDIPPEERWHTMAIDRNQLTGRVVITRAKDSDHGVFVQVITVNPGLDCCPVQTMDEKFVPGIRIHEEDGQVVFASENMIIKAPS